MDQSPFAKRPVSKTAVENRRRSTRVDFVVPVTFAGRDASGQIFQEETETSTVNLHGAKIKTCHEVLIGSQVVVKNRQNGMADKAICVWVGECPAGENAREIAVQLVKPRNLWGIENPPSDWLIAGEAELPGDSTRSQTTPTAIKIPSRPASTFSSATGSPTGISVQPSVDSRLTELEQQSAQLMECALQSFRQRADEIVREALEKFEDHLAAVAAGAETRVVRRAEKANAELNSSLDALLVEATDKLAVWTQQSVESAEEALREKVMEAFFRAQEAFSPGPSAGTTGPKSKK